MNRDFLRMAPPLAAVLCIAVFASDTDLTSSEREHGLRYLEETRNGVVEATKGLSDRQWKFKPGPDRWSIAEVVEHLAVAEDLIMNNLHDNFLKAPAGASDRDAKQTDSLIVTKIPDRSQKFQAPPSLVPTGRWTPAGTLEHFLAARVQTVAFLESTPDLRGHVMDFPPLGQAVDGYEWVLAISAHTARHTKQILEVKADPNFPAN